MYYVRHLAWSWQLKLRVPRHLTEARFRRKKKKSGIIAKEKLSQQDSNPAQLFLHKMGGALVEWSKAPHLRENKRNSKDPMFAHFGLGTLKRLHKSVCKSVNACLQKYFGHRKAKLDSSNILSRKTVAGDNSLPTFLCATKRKLTFLKKIEKRQKLFQCCKQTFNCSVRIFFLSKNIFRKKSEKTTFRDPDFRFGNQFMNASLHLFFLLAI